MANDKLKKPENDNKVPLTEEENEKRKKIIILIILIIVVLAILIGTAYYFSNSGKEKDSDNDNKNNPGTIVNPSEDKDDKEPEPVVQETTANNNNVIVYRPVKRPVQPTPSEPETPTTVTGSDVNPLVQVDFDDETRTITLSGISRYVAKAVKIDDDSKESFHNVVQVKIVLNSKYKYSDLKNSNFIITTEVNNGKMNYFSDIVQEDEDGNLYFYWIQAVGNGLSLTPKLTINYGDGNIEEYTMDLSDLNILTPLEDDSSIKLAQALISTKDQNVVYGGVELDLDYKMTILEALPITSDDGIVTADENLDSDDSETITTPEDKDYVLKITGIDDTLTAYEGQKAIDLGFEGYKYIIAVKLYAPDDVTYDADLVNKVKATFKKSYVDGEGNNSKATEVTLSSKIFNLIKETDVDGNDKYYIIVTMAVDGVYPDNIPYVSIDWDADGDKHGTTRYIFDFSEFNYIEESEDDVDSAGSEISNGQTTETGKGDVTGQGTSDNGSSDDTQGKIEDTSEGNDEDEENITLADVDTDDEDKNDIDDEDTSNEDMTPIGEEDLLNSPDTTVPSVETPGDGISEVQSPLIENLDAE